MFSGVIKTPFLSRFLAVFDIAAAIAELVVADTVVFKVRADIAYRGFRDVTMTFSMEISRDRSSSFRICPDQSPKKMSASSS